MFFLLGYPSCGKTTFAELLSSQALSHESKIIKSTVIINEESARPDKTLRECYLNSTEEKLTRSALKSEFDKHIKDPNKLVILDSINYIKGFRYELHCISKAAGQKHGVIWTLNREDIAKAWNEDRSKHSDKLDYFYTAEMIDELMSRYEPPDQRNRWDRPLYRVDVHSTLPTQVFEKLGLPVVLTSDGDDEDETGNAASAALNRSVYNMHSLSDAIRDTSQSKVVTTSIGTKSGFKRRIGKVSKTLVNTENKESSYKNSEQKSEKGAKCEEKTTEREIKSMEALIKVILDSFLLDVVPLKAGLSTSIQRNAETNVLHDVDSISQKTMNAFISAQKNISAGGGRIIVPIGSSGESRSFDLRRQVKAIEVKRLRRQYVKWVTSNPPKDSSEEGIANSFLSYLGNQI